MSEDSYSEKRLINSPFYKDANELRFEISVLNRQLEVAKEALEEIIEPAYTVVMEDIVEIAKNALAEIERLSANGETSLKSEK
jgi:hypothetical protein